MKRFKDLRIGSWNVVSLYRSQLRKAGIQTSGTIFYKSAQLLAYADGRCQDVGG